MRNDCQAQKKPVSSSVKPAIAEINLNNFRDKLAVYKEYVKKYEDYNQDLEIAITNCEEKFKVGPFFLYMADS